MDFKQLTEKTCNFLKNNKYVVLILLTGIIFLLIPETNDQNDQTQTSIVMKEEEISFEEKLAAILNQIDGAGEVKVLLTISEGEEIIFQTDENLSTDSDTSSKNTDTITVTDANKNQDGLIRQKNPPVYRGAIIVCQGANDPVVKLAVTEAVSRLTGIGTNCISVLKMK